jgi:hypothetical protein
MLNPSYAAIQQFQRLKNSVDSIQSLKELLRRLEISMSIEVTSSSFWKLDWDLLEDQVSGTLEVGILPKLIVGSKVLQKRDAASFRIEEAMPIAVSSIETRLLDLIKQSLETIG